MKDKPFTEIKIILLKFTVFYFNKRDEISIQ